MSKKTHDEQEINEQSLEAVSGGLGPMNAVFTQIHDNHELPSAEIPLASSVQIQQIAPKTRKIQRRTSM